MRIRAFAVVLALGLLGSTPRAATSPKLAVIIVVDQMRADYVERFQSQWTGGLKRMVTEGAWFRRAAYPYLNTFTCAGHATVGTGAYPVRHGIFQNQWFDRDKNAMVTCTGDPSVQPLVYGHATGGNESPINLKVPTFADEMRRQKNSHAVSLSFKARSAIMLAGHGGDSVTWLSETLDGWETSTAFSKELVPQVKAFIDANPIEADFGKSWTLTPNHKYQSDDNGRGEAPPAGWTATFPHALTGSGQARPDPSYYAQWERSPFADAYIARMAASLVESMQLGKHDGTDVLTLSFSTPDVVGHAFGPKSLEIEDLYLHLDQSVGTLFDALDRIVGKDQWVAGLSADHGVTEIPEQLMAAGRPGGRLDLQGMGGAIEREIRKQLGTTEQSVVRIIANDTYLRAGVLDQLNAKPGALNAVLKAAQSIPGIERAFAATQLTEAATTSKDQLLRAAALGFVAGRSGDILIAPKPGWMAGSTGTTHGSANPDDQRVPVLFYGAGIKAGRYNDAASPADVAPTLASIVGITLPQAQGKPLTVAIASGTVNPSSR